MAKFIFYGVPDNFSREKLREMIYRKLNQVIKNKLSSNYIASQNFLKDFLEIEFSSKTTTKRACLIITSQEIIEFFDFYFTDVQTIFLELHQLISDICQEIFEIKEISTQGETGETGKIEIHFAVY